MIRTIGPRTFDFDRQVAVMAIINRTPDSFYDHGATFRLEDALLAIDRAIAAGADWIDVGGVRAGPGQEVSEEEELGRVLPVVEAIRERASDVVISVDTWRPAVAREVLAAGTHAINDAFGLYDPGLADVVAEAGGHLIVTHYGHRPRTPFLQGSDGSVVDELVKDLDRRAGEAISRGVSADHLVLDPGFDMHKGAKQSLEIVRRLNLLTALGYPVLAAVSNKDFIGETLGLPLEDLTEGTIVTLAACVLQGANIVRVHDARMGVRAVRMLEAIRGWRDPAAPWRGVSQTGVTARTGA